MVSVTTGTRAGDEHEPAFDAGQRSLGTWATLTFCGLAFVAMLLHPDVAHSLRITWQDGALSTALFFVAMTATTAVYHCWGPSSRAYRASESVETLLVGGSQVYLIHASGTAQSFFWFFYLVHVFFTAVLGTQLRYVLLLLAPPLGLAAAFAVERAVASATLSALAGGLGIATYFALARVHDELAAVRHRESELKLRLAEVRVRQERLRIARDLHDGVGAELAGLIWRLRALAREQSNPGDRGQFSALERRLVRASDELRDVVLALRIEPSSWDEAIELLQERCHELCTEVTLRFRVEREPRERASDTLHGDVLPIVLELVRNAARHAHARRIDVGIRAGDPLFLRIADDGHGFDASNWSCAPGGLANVRRRVEDLGGRAAIHSDRSGTRIEISLPRPGPSWIASLPAPVSTAS